MAKKNSRKAEAYVKEQKEFEEEVLQIDRVTRVVKGGRRLRFRVTVAIGDKKGRVGVGVGKASEVVTGIHKAVSKAKASLIKVPITKDDTIPHAVRVKYKAAEMLIMPASPGTGVIAGGSLRKVLHLAGVKNVLSKNIGSRNSLVTAQASIRALKKLRPVKGSQVKKPEESKKEVIGEKAENQQDEKKTPPKEKTSKTTKKN
ncbi:30S ribosomal protein S5 [Patescibacteria group bacterium]|nr:30S ribosomal protein S5 [Patescibacteria group bacterium]MBU1016443.1 30S ribosomal protein S5 [Patescibacteria group bacterium]MBU1684941.1 30S ribosomal protein S5 [Patescibacteria group bacterium]MBU1939031.1 30S ribosomal protein S5 [Patescibacteria group bacterium]